VPPDWKPPPFACNQRNCPGPSPEAQQREHREQTGGEPPPILGVARTIGAASSGSDYEVVDVGGRIVATVRLPKDERSPISRRA
jgi:hypothetical protein